MSNKNIEMKLNIQTHKEKYLLEKNNLYKIPFHTNIGKIDLIIG